MSIQQLYGFICSHSELIEDEFNRVSDNDTNYINGQKKNGLDPLGYLFNLAGNSAQNIWA
jgi:hypothetical protein